VIGKRETGDMANLPLVTDHLSPVTSFDVAVREGLRSLLVLQ
jgi:hypothetical protein